MTVDLARVRAVVKRRRLTPEKLAALIGFRAATVADVLSGRRPAPEVFAVLVENALKLKPGALRPGLRFEKPDPEIPRMTRYLAVLILSALCLAPASARADDEPALPDGGSIVTPTDGGSQVTVDLGERGAWVLALTCEGAQSTRYRLCSSSACTASAHNPLLPADRTWDIPVNSAPGQNVSPKRYLALKTDDGGIPFCKAQRVR